MEAKVGMRNSIRGALAVCGLGIVRDPRARKKQLEMSKEGPMVSVFAEYAGFYDALYRDKDYEAEVDFLVDTFARYGVAPRNILDLGSGTGNHDLPLARRGYQVVGVDQSPAMVAQARRKADEAGLTGRAEFVVGDVRSLELGRPFDAVVSMFAVVSYMRTNDDLRGMFATARRHLEPGGLFVFDGWFGPAVLTQRPAAKTKVVELPGGEVVRRTATPALDVLAQTVTVTYDVERTSGGRVVETSHESHTVRFLFAQEVSAFLEAAAFELLVLAPFMELDRQPTADDWNVSVVARAR